jgi:hypothetical protein
MATPLDAAENHPGVTLGLGTALGYFIIGGIPGAAVGLGLGAVVARKGLKKLLPLKFGVTISQLPPKGGPSAQGAQGASAQPSPPADDIAGEDPFDRVLRIPDEGREFGRRRFKASDGMGDDGDDGSASDGSDGSGSSGGDSPTNAPAASNGGGGGDSGGGGGGDSGGGGSGSGQGQGQQGQQQPQPPAPPTTKPAAPAPPAPPGAPARPAPPAPPQYVAPTAPAPVQTAAPAPAAPVAQAAKKKVVHPAHHHHRK